MRAPHYPVMLAEVMAALDPKLGDIIVDGTLGAGGYARAILARQPARLFAFDRDASALAQWQHTQGHAPDTLRLCHAPFSTMIETLAAYGVERVDGIVLDLGVSSMQLDQAERGFSFRDDGPLDMRMDQSGGQTAADIVNHFGQDEIANILWQFGEERKSRAIARAIVQARVEQPFTTTAALADVIRRVVPKKPGTKIDAATRSFQALRIFVNDELGELDRALEAAESLLNDGGRLVVVSFHSLEDRRVKQFLRERDGRVTRGSRHLPQLADRGAAPAASFRAVSNKVTKPSPVECAENPRSRSALMRAAIRLRAPEQPLYPITDATNPEAQANAPL